MKIKRRKRLEIKTRKRNGGGNGGGGVMDKLISPCSGCNREAEDKRKDECGVCAMPHAYAVAVEKVYSHLPDGIDCRDIHHSTDGRVKTLTEMRLVY